MLLRILVLFFLSISAQSVRLPAREIMEQKIQELERSMVKRYIMPTPKEMYDRNMQYFTYYNVFLELADQEVDFQTIIDPIYTLLYNSLPRIGCWCCYSAIFRRIEDHPDYIKNLFDILFENETIEQEKELAMQYWNVQYENAMSKYSLSCQIM